MLGQTGAIEKELLKYLCPSRGDSRGNLLHSFEDFLLLGEGDPCWAEDGELNPLGEGDLP